MTWFCCPTILGTLVTMVQLEVMRSELCCKTNGETDTGQESTIMLVPASATRNCGTDTGEALTLKTWSKQTWPLAEMLTLMFGNGAESATSPLSKCLTLLPPK